MVGKVLALGVTGLIQIAVWVALVAIIGPHVFDQIPEAGQLAIEPGILALVIGFFLTGYLVFAVTMAGIGAATTSVKEASPLSMIVTLPSIGPVWFLWTILDNPDGVFPRLLSFIPFTAPVTMMVRLAASDVSLSGGRGELCSVAADWYSSALDISTGVPWRNAHVWPTDESAWRVLCSPSGELEWHIRA